MSDFQKKTYELVAKKEIIDDKEVAEDALDRKTGAAANFVFPAINDKKELIGVFGRDGLNTLTIQLKQQTELLNNKITKGIFKDDKQDYVYMIDEGKKITGKLYDMNYVKTFSTKFYEAIKNLNNLVYGKTGAKTALVS